MTETKTETKVAINSPEEQAAVEQFAMDYFPEVAPYVKIPSISAQGKGINETVAWIKDKFASIGATRVEAWSDQGGNPVVFAEFEGASDSTIMFYNHYDVQPPEPIEEWRTEPFEPTFEEDGTIRARGIGDDKGELMSRITAMQYMYDHGGYPCHIKFVVEGEEEIGSIHFNDYVQSHQADMACDVCVWEGGSINEQGHFTITGGVKGCVAFDMSVQTADVDMHSSMAAYVDNAAWRMVQALNSIRTADGHIKVDGYYDNIEPISQSARDAITKMDFDADGIRERTGMRTPFTTDDPKTASVTAPTITINGIEAGYNGSGVKTVIPRYAKAKIDCRIVPGQDAATVYKMIRQQLDQNGFEDLEMHFNLAEEAFRSDIDSPFFKEAERVAEAVYGEGEVRVIPNSAGSGPEAQMDAVIHAPIVAVGCGYFGSGAHAPNESMRVRDYQRGTYFMVRFMRGVANFGQQA